MDLVGMFTTPLWVYDFGEKIDNNKLYEELKEFTKTKESRQMSNRGGEQYGDFRNNELFSLINGNLPQNPDYPLKEHGIVTWVNVNSKGDYNVRHTHFSQTILLSGIYYVKVPKNSGNIRFYDPRGPLISDMTDHRYYSGSYMYHELEPDPGTLIFFPPWIEHDVTPNESEEERVSIAFNIIVNPNILFE